MPEQMKFKYIDALRGAAILGVLIVHCGQYGMNDHLPSIIQTLVLNGAHGVQLFYVVSAFTLFLTLAKGNPEEKATWVHFYVRRFFRIAPMYYLGICYFLWQDGLGPRYFLGDAPGISAANIVANVLFIHGFNPYWITSVVPGGWSIAVEMLFYCLIPLLFVTIKNTRQAFVFFLIALALRVVLQFALNRMNVIESERLWQEFLNFYLPNQLPVFALGILLYFILKDDYGLPLSPRMILVLSAVFILHFAGIPILPNHVLLSIGFVGLAVALSRFEFKLFVNPVLVHLGRVSYSMYLVHFAVLFWLNRFNAVDYLPVSNSVDAIINYGFRLMILLVIATPISSLLYHLIELPCQRMGKMLIMKMSGRIVSVSPAIESFNKFPVAPASPGGILFEKTVTSDTPSGGTMNVEK